MRAVRAPPLQPRIPRRPDGGSAGTMLAPLGLTRSRPRPKEAFMVPTLARTRRFGHRFVSMSLLSALAAVGCGTITEQDVEEVTGDVPEAGALSSSAAPVTFAPFDDDVGTRAATETRAVIRSRRGYQDFFGHAPPASVDFSRQWVLFYAAGTKPTGGYQAHVAALVRAGHTPVA